MPLPTERQAMWPNFVVATTWTVEVLCEKTINSRAVPEGTTKIHRIRCVTNDDGWSLPEALEIGREMAQDHKDKVRPPRSVHHPQEVGVRWAAKCRHDNTYISGWNQEGMADALHDHILSYAHRTEMEIRQEAKRIGDLFHT